MAGKKPQSRIGGRDSKSGGFGPLSETRKRLPTNQRDHIPLPGKGNQNRGRGGKK